MTKEKAILQMELTKGIEAALARAARNARRIAQQTGTPLVTYRDGKVVKERIARRSK